MKKTPGWLVSGFLACTTACAAPPADRAALDGAIQRWTKALDVQDVRTLTATMTEDVELMDGSASFKGRDSALRRLRDVATRGRLVATTQEITIAGDVAWRVLGLTQRGKNGVVNARGQSLEIWKRVNGEWRLHRQMIARVADPAVSVSQPSLNEPVLDRARD